MYKKMRLIFFLLFVLIICSFSAAQKGVVMAENNQIQLPESKTKSDFSLEEAIAKRRSQRNFAKKDLKLEQISQLFWAAQGITARKGGWNFRSAPSAGALYPMELYLVSNEGVFHYLPQEHVLELVTKEDRRKLLSNAALGQEPVRDASIDIVICAVYARVTRKYGQRGLRYAHIEAGHVAQNIHLQAVSLGLGSVSIGAFDDQQVRRVLNVPKDYEPLYIIPVGYVD